MKQSLLLFCTLTVLFILSSCTVQNSNSQIANPASKKCVEDGYQIDIRTNTDGSQTGYCILSDLIECEEWQYYKGECPQ